MPGYKGHLVGGAGACGVTIYFLYLFNPVVVTGARCALWLGVSLAGSLFPDVDTKSKGQKYLYHAVSVLLLLLILARCFIAVSIVSLCSMLPLLVNHRGLFHRLWFVIGVPFACAWSAGYCMPELQEQFLYAALFFSAGSISHLWLDLGFSRMMRW